MCTGWWLKPHPFHFSRIQCHRNSLYLKKRKLGGKLKHQGGSKVQSSNETASLRIKTSLLRSCDRSSSSETLAWHLHSGLFCAFPVHGKIKSTSKFRLEWRFSNRWRRNLCGFFSLNFATGGRKSFYAQEITKIFRAKQETKKIMLRKEAAQSTVRSKNH